MVQNISNLTPDAAGARPSAACSIACDLCGSTSVDQLSIVDRDGSYLRTVICTRCGLVWSDPRPTTDELREYYSKTYRLDYKGTWQPKAKHIYRAGEVALERCNAIRELITPGAKTLDIGAGGGEMVYVQRALGYDASGLEPNEGYARFASETLGLPVRNGFYQDAHVAAGSLDLVTMYHVVEHLDAPRDVLQVVRRWLKPDGYLIVEVPNVEAICSWPKNRFHRAHLYNFSLATLEGLFRGAGYNVIRSFASAGDAANITVIGQNSPATDARSGELPGNFDRVSRIVRQHTPLRHTFSAHPYRRVTQKLRSRMNEWLQARDRQPRQILDALVARHRDAS